MKGRALVVAGAGVFALTASASAVLVSAQQPGDASARSRGSRGWLAARRYLEEMGCEVRLHDRALDAPLAGHMGVLVLAFPWQAPAQGDVRRGIERHLQGAGAVVFAYSGQDSSSETAVASALGLEWDKPRGDPPTNPVRWREYAAEEWRLTPGVGEPGGRKIRIGAPQQMPRPPRGAITMATGPEGRVAAFWFTRGRGRVVVLPADAFSNARVGEPGNADLLEVLRQDLTAAWTFDEYHHGLRAAVAEASRGSQRIFALYLAQIGFIYLLVVLAVVPRFGPAWREEAAVSGSVSTFLLGLGAMHHRLGHHRPAARVLLSRARELDPRLELPGAADPGDLLELARRIGRVQSGGRKGA